MTSGRIHEQASLPGVYPVLLAQSPCLIHKILFRKFLKHALNHLLHVHISIYGIHIEGYDCAVLLWISIFEFK